MSTHLAHEFATAMAGQVIAHDPLRGDPATTVRDPEAIDPIREYLGDDPIDLVYRLITAQDDPEAALEAFVAPHALTILVDSRHPALQAIVGWVQDHTGVVLFAAPGGPPPPAALVLLEPGSGPEWNN